MTRYAGNAEALRALVREQEVHRDVYVSEEVFQLEMEHMFPNSWVYVGHDSQVPNPGDYFGTTIGTQPVLLVRHTDGTVKVLHNRCPHKGTFFGESLSSFDNMVDRSPAGRLEVAGGVLRYMHNCNWKMLVENQTDTCHPMVAHESSAGTVVEVWKKAPPGTKKPMAVEIIAPFMSPYEFFENMGIRIWDNGHGHTGVHHSIHSDYSAVSGYFDKMTAAYGEARAKAILDENRHNTVYFPNIMIKGPIQLLRQFKPIAANKTLVESWTFQLVDAPDMLLERTLMYNRLINAPTSIVGHDDLEMYERAQEGLHSNGNEWVNLQRLYSPDEAEQTNVAVNGTSEWPMRHQFRAWSKFMTMGM